MPLPSLLVSVRNLAEARAAIRGGCDRLDVKEPLRGPLGMADPRVIDEIAEFCSDAAGRRDPIRCSVALGEIDESQTLQRPFALPRGVSDIKLGPARLGTLARWQEGWRRALGRWEQPLRVGSVAVAYADWQAAGAPRPDQILAAAVELGAGAFLIDTCQKETGNLLNAIGPRDLGRLARMARRAEMMLAVAGSLRLEHLAALVELRPDVIAVRGRVPRSASLGSHFVGLCTTAQDGNLRIVLSRSGRRLSMRDHESAMLRYIRLSDVSQLKRQPLGRDKLLLLAAAAACRAGWPDVAERCRAIVLEHNSSHLMGNFATVADALRSDDFKPLVKQHERLCGYERAEFLVNELGLEPLCEPAETGKTAGQTALELLSLPPSNQ